MPPNQSPDATLISLLLFSSVANFFLFFIVLYFGFGGSFEFDFSNVFTLFNFSFD